MLDARGDRRIVYIRYHHMFSSVAWLQGSWTGWIPLEFEKGLVDVPWDQASKCISFFFSSDFSLSVGCFGTDIIQKSTKWFQIGVHGLKFGQIFTKLQCVQNCNACIFYSNRCKNTDLGQTNAKMLFILEKQYLRIYTGHTKIGKKQFRRYNLIKLTYIQFNEIWLNSITNHIILRNNS